jgi:hypothetical protein
MKNNSFKSALFALLSCVLIASAENSASAQIAQSEPELSVSGLRLGDEESAKTVLQNYSPRYDNDLNQPKYFFYNGYGNQVMCATAHSKEHPFLVVAIEVFAVGESYQKKHFQMKETKSFMSESGFFIGARPSAASLIFAIPNVTGPKEIMKRKGQPKADEKSDKVRTLRYQTDAVKELETQDSKLKDINFGAYEAEFRFYKNKLSRFSIAVIAADTKALN